MFSLFRRKKEFFTAEEKQLIVDAVRSAERMTSGEVRVFVESKCPYMDAIDRASQLFFKLEMERTDDRNGVLIYVATKDRQLAVFGDEGIHKKVGDEYWKNEVNKMIQAFNKDNYAEGIRQVITDVGQTLTKHFPYNNDTDKNELPDDIVFGK
jgi:uncharacterized membrane protein